MEEGNERAQGRRNTIEITPETTNARRRYLIQQRLNNRQELRYNLPWGDDILEDKEDNSLRVYYHNINGINHNNEATKASEVAMALYHKQVDVMGFSETNTDWNQKPTKQRIHSAFKTQFKNTHMTTSTSTTTLLNERHQPRPYKPGGTATIVTGKHVGRIQEETNDDPLGNYSLVTLRGRQGTAITIITAYRVPQRAGSTNAGSSTAYQQQHNILRMQNVSNPDPRNHVLKDLQTLIERLQANDHEILLMIDANESLGARNSKIEKLRQDTNLLDLHTYRHGLDGEPETFIRNANGKRIDYMLGSQNVANAVQKAGIEPYGEGYQSDHRGLFIDININELLAGQIAELDNPLGRGIGSASPKSVAMYKQHVIKYFDDHTVVKRLRILESMIVKMDLSDERDKRKATDALNAIDRDVTRALLAAEKQIRKRDPVAFSPKLMAARKIQRYWRLWLTELRTNRDMSHQRSVIEATQPAPLQEGRPTLHHTLEKLRESKTAVREVVQTANELREKFLQDKADGEPNKDKEAALRSIIAKEKARQDWSRLKMYYKPNQKRGMTHVIAPSDDPKECAERYKDPNPDVSNWKHVFDVERVEKILQARNQAHFGQAKGTPFTVPPLSTMFGWCGTTKQATDFLEGNTNVDEIKGIDKATREILRELAQPIAGIESISNHLSTDDMTRGFKNWRESTSTSPSGRHLGHYKAVIAYKHLEPKETDEGETLVQPSQHIMGVISDVADLAIRNGIILDRWLDITNVMIEKIPGQPLLHKLRVLHLFEADLNLALGILWGQRLMRQAERLQMLGDQQYGSRKGKCAEDVVLLKQLTYELMNITKTDGGTFDNDAKACYDRIIPNMMYLCAQRLGMPITSAQLHSEILQQARYRLKTTLGVSEVFYTNSEEQPLFGPGQGGTASAFAWAIIVAILLLIMKRRQGIEFGDPEWTKLVQRVMDAFVDDTTAWVNKFLQSLDERESNFIYEITEELTATAQEWETLLNASGGALELSKCFYYLVHWEFDKKGNAKMTDANLPPIQIQSSATGESVTIKQQHHTEPHKTLGVKLCPTCDMKWELERLQAIASKFARQTHAAILTKQQARKAYQSIYIGRIQYGISASTLQEQDYNSIQSPAIRALLPKLGYNRNTPTSIVYGPISEGGIGLQSLYPLQGTKKVMTLIENCRNNSKVGNMMMITLAWTQLAMGVGFNILKEPGRRVPPSTGDQWFRGIREFLHKSDCQLDFQESRTPQPRRQGDTTIIDLAIAHKLNDSELRSIQKVRLYLQILYVSDACEAKGTRLLHNIAEQTTITASSPTARFPRQGKPGHHEWKSFQSLLHKITKTTNSPELRTPLGPWLPTWKDDRTWKAVYCTTQEYYWIHDDNNKWTCYTKWDSKRTYNVLHQASSILPDGTIPECPVPIDIVSTNNSKLIQVSKPPQAKQSDSAKPKSPANIHEYINTLPKWEQELLRHAESHENGDDTLQEALQQGKQILIGYTGNHEQTKGTYGWVIKAFDRTLWKGWGIAQGQPMSPFRAKGYGNLAAINFVYRTWTFHSSTIDENTAIKLVCDNQSLITRQARFRGRLVNRARDYSEPDHDIIMTIERILKALPNIRTNHELVSNQQDSTRNRIELSQEARINSEAHDLATEQMQQLGSYHNPTQLTPLPDCPAYLIHRGQYITSGETTILRSSISRKHLAKYLKQRHKWTQKTSQLVDWRALRTARTSIHRRHRFATRFMHDWLPTRTKLFTYQQTANNECPCCQQPETHDHMFQCPERVQWRTEMLERLDKHLAEEHTDPAIREQVKTCMRMWLSQSTSNDLKCHQQTIGLRLLLRGFVGVDWTHKQERYYRDTHNPYNPKLQGPTWTRNLILFMWNEAHALWLERNESIHNPESTIQRQDIEQEVRNLYEQQEQVLAEDRGNFDTSLQHRIQQNTQELLAFVQIQGRTIAHSIREHAIQATANVRRITDFFRPR